MRSRSTSPSSADESPAPPNQACRSWWPSVLCFWDLPRVASARGSANVIASRTVRRSAMDFDFSDEHKAFQQTLRRFFEKESPTEVVTELDRSETFPRETYAKMADL